MIKVVKIGGNVVDDADALARFATAFAQLEGPKILVHGGGKEASRLSKQLNLPTTMIDGRRVTDADTLRVVTMVYAGLINKRVVSLLQAAGCNALGLSGCDANAITATLRPATPIDYGFVGDIGADGVNRSLLRHLLDGGITPVFCAITHDGHGTLLNCNADSVASAVAVAVASIAPTELVYCFEQPGVMADINRSDSLIPEITQAQFAAMKADGTVNCGMIPKLQNAFAAIANGVCSVTIKHADNLNRPIGTTLRK